MENRSPPPMLSAPRSSVRPVAIVRAAAALHDGCGFFFPSGAPLYELMKIAFFISANMSCTDIDRQCSPKCNQIEQNKRMRSTAHVGYRESYVRIWDQSALNWHMNWCFSCYTFNSNNTSYADYGWAGLGAPDNNVSPNYEQILCKTLLATEFTGFYANFVVVYFIHVIREYSLHWDKTKKVYF